MKKENQFEDAVLIRNLSDREISGLQDLRGYVIHNLYKKLRNSKNYKSDGFQQSMALRSACRVTNTEMLQNQKLVSVLNRGGLWVITEDMQKFFLVVAKYFTNLVEKKFIRKIPVDDIVFELKNFLYIKAFFNKVLKSKLHPKLQKMFQFNSKTIYKSTYPFICLRYCTEK